MILMGIITTMTMMIRVMASKNMDYNIESLKANPGIYFEKLHTIRVKRADWRITIYIDIQDFMKTHGSINSLQTVMSNCTLIMRPDTCNNLLGMDLIESKYQTLKHVQGEINDTIKSLGHIEYPSLRLPRSIKTKRNAPLGIIGSISKSLFGLVTEEDVNDINNNIDKIFKDQTKMIHLLDESSHIVSAKFEELYNITQSHQDTMKEYERIFADTINKTNKLQNEVTHMIDLMNYVRRVEATLDHMTRSNERVLQVLRYLKEGKIHPELIKPDIIHQIAADVKRTSSQELDLPTPPEHLRIEEITRIGKVDAIHQNGRTLAILHLPLVDRTPYSL